MTVSKIRTDVKVLGGAKETRRDFRRREEEVEAIEERRPGKREEDEAEGGKGNGEIGEEGLGEEVRD